jgi:hypothetical protein
MSTHIATLARLTGTLLLLFFLAFVLAEGPPNPLRLTASEALYAAGMLALYGGLALAWRNAKWGGAVTIGGWLFLAILSGRVPFDWPLALPAAVGVLFLVSANAPKPPTPLWAKALLYGPLPVFVLLCANEMFGNPPLMAVPVGELTGTCSVPSAAITVHSDATVTGTVANVPIQRARIEPNRSWFGRLLGWRTDYRIRGELTTGEPLNILLNAKPTGLTGTVESPRR